MDPVAPTPDPTGLERPFVGRAAELGDLRAALASAAGGCGRIVLIGGEPGIGKTRLAAELAAEAEARGVAVWWGRCWEDGTAPVFWPWNAALRDGIRRAGEAASLAAAGPLALDLAQVFPVLRERLPHLPPAPDWQSDQARFRLFDIVSRFLAAAARPAGLLVVLDDVQWADAPSLKLLEFVAADLPHARLLILVTYRDGDVRRGDPAFAAVSRLARQPLARRLTLRGLSAAECGRFVTLARGGEDGAALGVALHRETNGNPFFLGEIVHLLGGDGRLGARRDRRRLPPGVRDVVSQRLDRLGPGSRPVLAVAALLGTVFDVRHVEAIVRGAGAGDAAAVGEVVDRALRDGMLVAIAGRPGRYAFAHALVRYVLIDEVPPSERAVWHERIGEHLEGEAGTQTPAIATRLVRHFAASATPAALRKAFLHAWRGAERAAHRVGWEEAVRLYGIALDAGKRSGALGASEAIEIEFALARALGRSGDVAAARARCRMVADVCRQMDRPDLLVRVALLLAELAPGGTGVDAEVGALLEEACRVAGDVDDALRARLYARFAADIVAADDVAQMDRAVSLSREAVEAARRSGDPGALAAAWSAWRDARLSTAPPDGASAGPEPVPPLGEMLALAESAGALELAAQIRHSRIVDHFSKGDAERFWAEHDALASMAVSSRVPAALWVADAIGAMRAIVEGRFEEGRLLSDRTLERARRMQLTRAAGAHLSQQIMWYALQGRLAELWCLLGDSPELRPELRPWRSFLAIARLAAGDRIGARVELESLLAEDVEQAERGVYACSRLAGLAALCIGLRDDEHAPQLYDRLLARPERWVITGWATFGPWALARGSLARLCGRLAEAATHFEEAILLGRQMRARPVVAQAQSLLAATWLAADPDAATRERAHEALAEAEQEADALGLLDASARVARLRAKLSAGQAASRNVFRRDGEFWTIRYAGTRVRLKDAKGLGYLAMLLAAPGRELHVLQLAGGAPERPAPPLAGLRIGGPGASLPEAPDVRARQEYRERIADLRTELDEAERFGDLGRAERLRTELDGLVRELGRPHVSGPAEKARKAVTKALRTQIGKLIDEHPLAGRHFGRAVRMGTFCVYAPPARVEWET